MKKLIAMLLAAVFAMSLAACAQKQQPAETTGISAEESVPTPKEMKTVGVCLPNQTAGRWVDEGAELVRRLEDVECQAVLQDAQDDPWLQAEQISQLIAQQVDCMVVAAVDSLVLTEVLQQAKQAGIPVVAYDRMLMQTDAVSCFVAFEHQDVGLAIAEYIIGEKQLQTAQAEGRSYSIEFLSGSPEDNSALLVYTGAMSLLQGYLDSGVLVCASGRTAFEDTCIQGESAEIAAERCAEYWALETKPDILCAASDSIAKGCVEALVQSGCTAEEWPIITGQNADPEALERILSGQQAVTVRKDAGLLAAKCVEAVETLLAGGEIVSGDICDNGILQVTAVYCAPVTVDRNSSEISVQAD